MNTDTTQGTVIVSKAPTNTDSYIIVQTTHSLRFHPLEYDANHLAECSLGSGLVDEIPAGQVDIVTSSHGLQ